MASILSRFSRRFRTRDPARDAATDAARLATVRAAITDAIADAERECDGLKRRIAEYYTQAALLLDDAPDYGERSADEEQEISAAERSAALAQRRIEAVDHQVARLSELLRVLDGETAAKAA